MNLLGQSIGIISLGKKLLLIEGEEASLDKQTYGAILRNEFPELVLVPVGGKSAIRSFDEVRESILNRTIWGVEFFMLCDRDAINEIGARVVEAHLSDRLKILPRYHIENYFLEESILASIFTDMELEDSWLRNESEINNVLRQIAREALPLAVALKVAANVRERIGNIDVMPSGIGTSLDEMLRVLRERIASEKQRIDANLDVGAIEALARAEHEKLTHSIDSGSFVWKREIPGRVVFNKFASRAQMKAGRLKTLYLRKAESRTPDPFAEIREIFRSFRRVA